MSGQQPGMEKSETIRQWYDRTTSNARKSLIWVSAISIVFGVCFFMFAPLKLAQFMQTANGAVTIPIAGGIWIAAFVYIFLVPSREVGFRSQESIEQTVEILNNAVEKQINPALATWQRIGIRVEAELNNGLMDQIKETIKELREATTKITSSAETSNGEIKKFTDDAKPAIEALKRIQSKIEVGFGGNFVEDLHAAVASVKHMSLPPPEANLPAKEPKYDKALAMISKKPQAPKAVIPPPPLMMEPKVETPAQNLSPVPVVVSAAPVVVPVAIPLPASQNQGPAMVPAGPVAPAAMPVMVQTEAMQNSASFMTQPVSQAPTITPAAPSSRFSPAPPPSPIVQGNGFSQPYQQPVGGGNPAPFQIVLPPSSSQRQAPVPAPELSGSSRLRPGSVDLPLTQKSKPVVVTPFQPPAQMGGITVQGGPVQMVGAPQVILRSEG